ncbi:transcription antitermination factor NusB [Eilatimonas milleporae]|uniref:Transcription antitermination protein NusB n=1 Tax=Eilatimonas milleporae TaxID=911205 RepID=A0A3M0CY09_9PROT|nr:transcription antitermination factor NusB [Eilatimonas milleporae]RMB08883.1 NusB antitermination factor [Eilatimonas milleporae]
MTHPNRTAAKTKPRPDGSPRSAARLAAVQALYQLAMDADAVLPMVIEEYQQHRLGAEIEGDQYVAADKALFADIASGAWRRREELDGYISARLSEKWSLERLEPVLLAILRAGTYELAARPDVPTAVVINEYMDVGHAFFDRSEVSFANGILDKIAKDVR